MQQRYKDSDNVVNNYRIQTHNWCKIVDNVCNCAHGYDNFISIINGNFSNITATLKCRWNIAWMFHAIWNIWVCLSCVLTLMTKINYKIMRQKGSFYKIYLFFDQSCLQFQNNTICCVIQHNTSIMQSSLAWRFLTIFSISISCWVVVASCSVRWTLFFFFF